MRVLLAEDDPHFSQMLERLLESRGYEVLKTAHVADVAAVLEEEEPPPMALVERELPGGGGAEVCRLLKRARAGYTYVIMLTGLADEAAVRSAVDVGANDLIEKPLDVLDLAARVAAGRHRVEALEGLWEMVGRDPVASLWIQRHAIELPRAAMGSTGQTARRMVWQ
jgi:sigma-B regulation protein RsbU (phosphoserine phosphatase)